VETRRLPPPRPSVTFAKVNSPPPSPKLGPSAPADKKPAYFVFHGGSGSDLSDIRKAIDYGVIKMNIDTDTQWSYWEGIKNFEDKFR
jgi:fructose-bisphosphate aldolase class II